MKQTGPDPSRLGQAVVPATKVSLALTFGEDNANIDKIADIDRDLSKETSPWVSWWASLAQVQPGADITTLIEASQSRQSLKTSNSGEAEDGQQDGRGSSSSNSKTVTVKTESLKQLPDGPDEHWYPDATPVTEMMLGPYSTKSGVNEAVIRLFALGLETFMHNNALPGAGLFADQGTSHIFGADGSLFVDSLPRNMCLNFYGPISLLPVEGGFQVCEAFGLKFYLDPRVVSLIAEAATQ